MASPVQVVLNPDNYEEAREAPGGGPKKDFFAGRDGAFREHKTRLAGQLRGAAETLERQNSVIGYLKVMLRREGWAKSHRPVNALFRPERTPVVGGTDLGIMIVESRPRRLRAIAEQVDQAEEHTVMRFVESLGKEVPYPSALRSETGAIDRVELFGQSDRRDFSLEEAVAWLSNTITGSGYEVELFDTPPPRHTWDTLDRSHRVLYQSFVEGLNNLGGGLTIQRLATRAHAQPLLSMRLDRTHDQPTIRLSPPPHAERRHELAPFDPSLERHRKLLNFLDNHPLVRRILLPGIVMRSNVQRGRTRPDSVEIPTRNTAATYPRVGVIDGGIGHALTDWLIGQWDILAEEDVDLSHGSFIGGLLVAGQTLNGSECCPEPDGAEIVDLAIFPDDQRTDAFSSYYPEGLPHFFDELENAISDARTQHRVRIFNMSLNVLQPTVPDRYSPHAARIDALAEATDTILFVSAGNIQQQDLRPEWPNEVDRALVAIAEARNDNLLTPAESIRNVAVAAVNPPGHVSCLPFAPCRYSRRGPGLRTGNKPDLAHVGGSGSPTPALGHGLFSVTHSGSIIDGCGTSYAAPLAAKTAAALDHSIEGEVSRETLIGLLVHNARMPAPLERKQFANIARHLVGFGVPPSASEILETDDHEITLVFASRIRRDQQVTFRFDWPPCLVTADGKCRGSARLTLVSTPPIDPRFGAEFVRVNVQAALQQEQAEGRWKGRLDPLYLPGRGDAPVYEAEQIEHGLKWSPVKVYEKTMPRGVGPSSNWRLSVNYLTRSGEEMPAEGVPFTAILTISDPDGQQPVFNDLRQNLTAIGVQIADIRTAARITPRV